MIFEVATIDIYGDNGLECGQFLFEENGMKDSGIPVVFTVDELLEMRLGNGRFSVTRFKRIFRSSVRKALSKRYRELHEADLEVGRVAVRGVDRMTPKDFLLDVSCFPEGRIRWRQTFRYVFRSPGQSLSGFLIPGRKRYVE